MLCNNYYKSARYKCRLSSSLIAAGFLHFGGIPANLEPYRFETKLIMEGFMKKRLVFLVLVFFVIGTLASFATGTSDTGTGEMKELDIRIMTDLSGPPTIPATEDVLTPILREKTGVTATPFPQPTGIGTGQGAIAQALIAGNNLPEIITESYFPPQPDGLQVLLDNDMVWDFHDMDFLKEMFPNYTSRIEQYGDLDVWYQQTQTAGDTHIRLDATFLLPTSTVYSIAAPHS